MRWWFRKKAIVEQPPVPEPEPEIIRIVVNALDHPTVCVWKEKVFRVRSDLGARINRAVISDEVEVWLAENMTGVYQTIPSPAANFVAELEFEKETDAVLFKMFWL